VSEPVAVVSRRGAQRVRGGHPWVFKSDVVSAPSAAGTVEVRDDRGQILGTALCSPASTITLRVVSRERIVVDRDFLRIRVLAALTRRRVALPDADAYRIVHGEADLLPGMFLDRYGDCVSIQTTCAAADRLEPDLLEIARELLAPRLVVLRDDTLARQHEKLRRHVTLAAGDPPATAVFHEAGLALSIDLLGDQKTGAYLDQSQNHVAVARYARGEALDCFTYHGGFALQLARAGCTRVTAIDQSAAALERCRANAERAGLSNLEYAQANVFDLLPELAAAGRAFDLIVLDPPAFASSSKTLASGQRAYKEINLRALKLLRPGGILVTCSCSGRLSGAAFEETLAEAAADASRPVQLLERRGAGPDHPVLLSVPETEYLKCRVLCVL